VRNIFDIYVRMTNKIHTLFPSFISIILSSTCFEQKSSSSGGYFSTVTYTIFHACVWCLVGNTLWLELGHIPAWKMLYVVFKVKVNQSRYRPGQAQRVPGSEGSQISWQRHRMVVGCQSYAPTAFTPRKCSWYSFLLEAESTPGP